MLRTGIPWNDLPERSGDDSTCHRRLAAWERIWQAFLSTLNKQGKLKWAQAFLDGGFVPAKKGERRELRKRGITPSIPERKLRKRKRRRRGRPAKVHPVSRQRWEIACFTACLNGMKR